MRSELTFLGDVEDAGKAGSPSVEDDQRPKAVDSQKSYNIDITGFQLSIKDTLAAASGATRRRVL